LTTIVVDASISASIILPDERTARSDNVRAMLVASDLYTPVHWPLEMGSLLVAAERRGRITTEERRAYLAMVREFQTLLDAQSAGPSDLIADLAMAAGLSVYDAAYLGLALRRGAMLATNDRRLGEQARMRGVEILTTLA
jgi:predicted nucleic acid-binding protein